MVLNLMRAVRSREKTRLRRREMTEKFGKRDEMMGNLYLVI